MTTGGLRNAFLPNEAIHRLRSVEPHAGITMSRIRSGTKGLRGIVF
jgi:hypothetical protein